MNECSDISRTDTAAGRVAPSVPAGRGLSRRSRARERSLRLDALRVKFGNESQRWRVVMVLLEYALDGAWPLKCRKDYADLAAACGLPANHTGAALKWLAEKKIVSLDWQRDEDALWITLEHDTARWSGVATICGRADWARRQAALRAANGLEQIELIEPDKDLNAALAETNRDALHFRTADNLLPDANPNVGDAPPNAGSERGHFQHLEVARRAPEETENDKSSMFMRPSCANAKTKAGVPPRARARLENLSPSVHQQLKNNLKPWTAFSMEQKKEALAKLETETSGDALRRIFEIILGEDVASAPIKLPGGRTVNGQAGKWIVATKTQRELVHRTMASVVERCFDRNCSPVLAVGGWAHDEAVRSGVTFGKKFN